MNALRVQGIVFSAGALLVALGTLALGRLSPRLELIVVAVLIGVLGVPHGALDTIFAKQLYGIRTLSGWLQFSLLYLLLAALVVGLWLWQPGLFLLGFLAISAAHFSGDPLQGAPWPARLFYGGSVILLPTIGHAQEIGRLFGLLVGDATAAPLVPWLRWLAWPWRPRSTRSARPHAGRLGPRVGFSSRHRAGCARGPSGLCRTGSADRAPHGFGRAGPSFGLDP